MIKLGLVILVVVGVTAAVAAADAPRERLLLDAGWKFYLGDHPGWGGQLDKTGGGSGPVRKDFNDLTWRTVNLPHDWAVELPFDAQADRSHGYKVLGPGYATNNIGWYRRKFTLSAADHGKRLWLEFDGVYRDCEVYLNNCPLTHHASGYNGFYCDISDVADYGGQNVLVVRVDASKFEGWFYEGAGIYRHVWLVKTAPLAVVPDGIFVYSTFSNNLPGGEATVHLQAQLHNWQPGAATARVTWQILGPSGKVVAATNASANLDSAGEIQLEQTAVVAAPELWSPESPRCYQLVTTVENAGQVVDSLSTVFGIRTVAFDPDRGFLLNGQPYVIKGTCNHQDHAGVGSALPDALQLFRVRRLKEMGCNAIRTSHNEPTPELLDACDQLGLLVMAENRRLGSEPQNLACLEQQIRQDRNHPCVFIWSLCNEEYFVQRDAVGARMYQTMQQLAHQLDPSRLCTAAMNSWSGGKPDGISTVADVQGFNYLNNSDMDGFHRSNPHQPCIGTEEASAYYTRGIYENTRLYDSAYDDNKPGYGATAEEWWKYYAARPWASGAFVWTGFDYRGEPSPFDWPSINSEFGILDTCGFPKDVFYYYQSWWTDRPVLHLMPHWNWPGATGRDIDVRAFANCQEVELFLNGRSLGRQAMPRNSHLQWSVKYEPGILSAKGYTDGKEVTETRVETTGEPAAIRLIPDRDTINADGEDCSVITVAVVDTAGRVVPTASNLVHFTLNGPGKIIGVGNGNPISHEADVWLSPAAVHPMALDDWRMLKIPDLKDRPEVAAEFDDRQWPRVDIRSAAGPLAPEEAAVYRTHCSLTTNDLADAGEVLLNFGMIDDAGWVYVNGSLAGDAHDWQSDATFEVKKYLHPGTNSIAVVVKNHAAAGGVNKGGQLVFAANPAAAAWQRSVFNGLAQVIVRTDPQAGDIQLSAQADGLTEGGVTLHSQSHPVRLLTP